MANNRIDNLYRERSLSTRKLTVVRDRINAWANSIPHHPYADLGSAITITEATEKPTYAVTLVTFYEWRCLMENFVPYHNEPCPRAPLGEGDIDVWSVPLPNLAMPGEGKDEVEQDIALTDTQSVVECDGCNGHGEVSCGNCNGSGTQDCVICNGGWCRCGNCHGSGQIESQPNDKYPPIHRNCECCAGRGECRCEYCGGRGAIPCRQCLGSRRLICGNCEGQGYMLHFLSVHQSKNSQGRIERVHHPATPDAWKCDATSLPAVTVKAGDSWDAERIKTPVPELNEAVRSLLKASNDPEDEDPDLGGNEFRIHGQLLRIRRVPHFEVNYSLNGESYCLWLHGSEGRVHAPTSPISEVRYGHAKEARKLLKQGGTARVDALAAIHRAAAMGHLSRQEESLRNKILLAISLPYLVGGVGGGLASLATIEWSQPPFVWWKLCLGASYGGLVGWALFKRTFLLLRKPMTDFACAFAFSAALAATAAFASYQVTAIYVVIVLLALGIKGGDEKPSPPKDEPATSSASSVATATEETEESEPEPDESEAEADSQASEHQDETEDAEPRAENDEAGDTVETIWARSVLGISFDASDAEISSAYRRKMTEYHPDKVAHLAQEYRDLAEQKSKDLNKAREILKTCSQGT